MQDTLQYSNINEKDSKIESEEKDKEKNQVRTSSFFVLPVFLYLYVSLLNATEVLFFSLTLTGFTPSLISEVEISTAKNNQKEMKKAVFLII